jgi:hypothetical protein
MQLNIAASSAGRRDLAIQGTTYQAVVSPASSNGKVSSERFFSGANIESPPWPAGSPFPRFLFFLRA